MGIVMFRHASKQKKYRCRSHYVYPALKSGFDDILKSDWVPKKTKKTLCMKGRD